MINNFDKLSDGLAPYCFIICEALLVASFPQSYNFNFFEAENGKVGIEKLLKHPCDGIILDLMMPVMDGFQFLTEVKNYNQLKDIPIIVLTAKDLTTDEVIEIEKDVSLVIQKTDLGERKIKDLVQSLVS